MDARGPWSATAGVEESGLELVPVPEPSAELELDELELEVLEPEELDASELVLESAAWVVDPDLEVEATGPR